MMIGSLSNGSGVVAKWGQSSKVQVNTEKSAKSAMTDGFIERIKQYAKEDAKQGTYMSKGYLQMEQAQMRKYVSPDRSGPKNQVMSAIQAALREPHPLLQALEKMLDKLSGGCSAKLKICSIQQTAEISAPNGEVIASYNSLGGGWMENQTKEEHKFFDEAAAVYLQAFREARAEMKANEKGQVSQGIVSTMDVRARESATVSKTKRVSESQMKTSMPSPTNEDVYIPNGGVDEYPAENLNRKNLSPEMASALASKYDVTNMTRNEYGSLLRDLRDNGVISSKDFSVGYGGEVPYTAPDGVRMTMGDKDDMGLEPWPFNGGKADFTKLLRSCAKYCERFVSGQEEDSEESHVGSSLAYSYHVLVEVFDQIGRAAQEK